MKKGRKAKKIFLDNEVITRSEVKQILENTSGNNHKQKSNKRTYAINETQITDNKCVNTSEKQSDKLVSKNEAPENISDDNIPQEAIKNQESKRSMKRKKYAQLLQEKQLKSLLTNQQRSLNYLSLWKHDKSKWKFEKLRQVWLQQNMYDIKKVPDEFFTILLDYFTQSKGKIKEAIIKNAVKIVEEKQLADADLKDTNGEISCDETKFFRARTVAQTLEI